MSAYIALHVSSHLVSILIALNDLVYGFLRKLFKGHHLAKLVLQLAERPLLYRKSWSLNTLVILDFKPEVEMWRFCACAVKNGRNQP